MNDIKYTNDHEWLRMESDGTAVVGITNYAQEQLGELVFVELPEVDSEVTKGAESATIESVKSASDLHAPASGTVIEVNEALAEDPSLANQGPTSEGWFFRLKLSDLAELEDLMDQAAYDSLLESIS